ncbi:MAG: LamG domain-containing protein [Terriglobales bacterium]
MGVVNAVPSATVGIAPGEVGKAIDLTAHGSYLTLGPDRALDLSLRGETLAAWVRFTATGIEPILSKGAAWYLGQTADEHLTFCADTAGGKHCITGTDTLQRDRWYHVAFTADSGGFVTLYVNARIQAQGRLANSTIPADTPLLIGSDATRHAFLDGWLDELMLYQRALTLPELKALVNMPACLAAHS